MNKINTNMYNLNRFYNFIIAWITVVFISLLISIYLLPNDPFKHQFLFWGFI